MKVKWFLVASLAVAVLALGTPQGFTSEKESLKIGMTISTSGNYAYASQSGFRGIQVWLNDVNRRGGIYVEEYGKTLPVELKYYDDRSDKAQVVKLYEKLITEDNVDVLIAPFGSTLTSAAAAITEKYKKFLTIWSAASDSIYGQGYQYIVSATEVPTSLMPKPEIEHMNSLGIQTIAMIYVDEPFPAGQAKYAKEIAEGMGMEVVYYEKYSKGTKDFTTLLEKVKASNPQAFYASAYLDDQINMIRQMKELDILFDYVYMVYSGQLDHWVKALGEDGLYIFGHTLYHEDLKWPVNAGMDRDEFEASYYELFPNAEFAPDFQTSLAYGAGVILEEIIKKAGSLEAPALKQAALDLSGKLVVMTGPYEIDETGKQLGMPFTVTQVQKDPKTGEYKLILVWPEGVASGTPIFPIPSWGER